MRDEDLNNDDFIWEEPEEPKKPKKEPRSPSPKPKPAQSSEKSEQKTRKPELSEDYALLLRQRSRNTSSWEVFGHHMEIYFFYNHLFRTMRAVFFFLIFIVLIALPAYRSRNSGFNLFDFIRQTFSSQALYADYERGNDVRR